MPEVSMPELAERLAAVCRELDGDDLREIMAEIDAEPLLERILSALAPGVAVEPAALSGYLDELDAKLVAYGIPGGLLPPEWRLYQPTPVAAGEAHPAIEVWACPTGRCTRWIPVDAGAGDDGDTPACTAQGLPLAKRQLSR